MASRSRIALIAISSRKRRGRAGQSRRRPVVPGGLRFSSSCGMRSYRARYEERSRRRGETGGTKGTPLRPIGTECRCRRNDLVLNHAYGRRNRVPMSRTAPAANLHRDLRQRVAGSGSNARRACASSSMIMPSDFCWERATLRACYGALERKRRPGGRLLSR